LLKVENQVVNMATVDVAPHIQVSTDTPPILQLLPFLSASLSTLSSVLSYIFWVALSAVAYLITPLTLLASALAYIFAPPILLLRALVDILVITPYHVTVYIFQALYPVYVFVGVACIIGAVIGLLARTLANMAGKALMGGTSEGVYAKTPERSRSQVRRRISGKGKKRVAIK